MATTVATNRERVDLNTSFLFLLDCNSLISYRYMPVVRMLESWQQTITGTAGKTRLLKGTASLPAAAVGLLRGTTPSY